MEIRGGGETEKAERLELPGGGNYQSILATQNSGRTQVDEVENNLRFYRDPGPEGAVPC